jgi:autotransporter-associated beta strand protein
MNKKLNLPILFAFVLAATPLASMADVFFTDDFTNGSTTNGPSIPGGATNASHTSYDIASTKNVIGGPTIVPGLFHLALNAPTKSAFHEAQAIFTTSQVFLNSVGDYIDITVVFTNTTGDLMVSDSSPPNSAVWLGLYNSGGSAPLSGGVLAVGSGTSTLSTTAGSPYATGNCANWAGYFSQVASNGVSRILTRPVQNGAGTTSANQELLGTGAGSGTFGNPGAAVLVTGPVIPFLVPTNAPTTLYLRITLSAVGTLTISNSIYSGAGTGGTILYSAIGTATGANFLTSAFDGFAVGAAQRNGAASRNPIMDISFIQIGGQSSPAVPPVINSQPALTTVANNGSCAYFVTASGVNLAYQWRRNGTNLINSGNISGVTSPTLIISPATSADALSGANGYYVYISNIAGNTNSFTNALNVVTATNLVWTGNNGSVWDVNNTVSWNDTNGNPSTFTFGEPVWFDDTASLRSVSQSGSYISPSSVIISNSLTYTFAGSGKIAGPTAVLVAGSGIVNLQAPNSYTGGTMLSNSLAFIRLQTFDALGSGPVTFAMAGSKLELLVAGSASSGINGNIQVLDDALIQLDGVGSYAGVFSGDLSGTVGKTLTLSPADLTTTNRYRVYGGNTTMNANIVLNGPATSQANYYGTCLATYHASGSQIYNGTISGNGGIVTRANGTTVLSGPNTYTGGTYPTTGTLGFGADSSPTVGTVTSGPIGTGPLFVAPELPNVTGAGTVLAYGSARTIANPLQYPSGTNNQTLVFGGTNDLTFTSDVSLVGLDNTGSPTNRIFQVNNTNGLATLSGAISGTGWGITKTGAGILVLTKTETYTGPTTVSGGTLRVNGALNAGSAVTVATNATLGGTGTINGPVTVLSGGILAPGNSIGTLTMNNNLTLSGNLKIEVNTSAGTTSDKVVVTGTLTNAGAGTVTVTNLGPALVQGDTFTLFNKAMSNGAALNITGGQVAWDNKLAIDGTIAVLGPLVNINPTNIVSSTSGGVLTLSWPADHIGWRLQVQTNSLSVGITTNWFDLAGTSTTNSVNITISTNGTVFYRLIYP